MADELATAGILKPFDPKRTAPLIRFDPGNSAFADSRSTPNSILYDRSFEPAQMALGDGMVSLGKIPESWRPGFSQSCAAYCYFEEPLKEAGEDTHFIPPELERFLPLIKMIAAYEYKHSPYARYKPATLLAERIIPPEDYPAGAWHQDCPTDRLTTTHIYTISDVYPSFIQTKARVQPGPIEDGLPDGSCRQLEPYELVVMTGYNIHRADILPQGSERTLLRVIYEGIPKDGIGLPETLRRQLIV